MKPAAPFEGSSDKGVVLRASRRAAIALTAGGVEVSCRMSSKILELAPGDQISLALQGSDYIIQGLVERRNALLRTYRGERRTLAANLDLVIVVAASHPPFSADFTDRVMAVCRFQGIRPVLAINKVDLPGDRLEVEEAIYRALGADVVRVSALTGEGMPALERLLAGPDLCAAALTGASGVGKSSLLNRLVPSAQVGTGEISRKTGQGRRTTSQAEGFFRRRPGSPCQLLVDLPGVHAFGIDFLPEEFIRESFAEFALHSGSCRFPGCRHLAEPECGVKDGLAEGVIAQSRYASYVRMVEEVRSSRLRRR